MKTARCLLAITLATAFGAAGAQTLPDADARYVERIDGRFAVFAGSRPNLENLAAGLRHGSQFKLTGSGETATVLPPTRPMGYGNVTRCLDLASRQLAAVGITEPTPREISAALTGGTVAAATGDVTLTGVLQLRSEGMGWGQIAHAIGVHPGMGSAKSLPPVPVTRFSGITTAAGTAVARPATGARQGEKTTPAANRGGAVSNAAAAAAQSAGAAQSASRGQGNAIPSSRAAGKP